MVLGNAAIERIATGFRFTEGPVYYGDGHTCWIASAPDSPRARLAREARKSPVRPRPAEPCMTLCGPAWA
jgi:hypothetical protein